MINVDAKSADNLSPLAFKLVDDDIQILNSRFLNWISMLIYHAPKRLRNQPEKNVTPNASLLKSLIKRRLYYDIFPT